MSEPIILNRNAIVQTLQLPVTVSIIQTHLDEFLQYSQALLLRDAARHGI